MKWIVLCITLMCIAAGCMNKSSAPKNSSALDITAPAAPQQYQPAPVAVQPVYDTTAAQPVTMSAPAAGASKYTVQKGDTLWKIAASKYGNGNQWQKLCSANPGLTETNLKAGQTISIPQ